MGGQYASECDESEPIGLWFERLKVLDLGEDELVQEVVDADEIQ